MKFIKLSELFPDIKIWWTPSRAKQEYFWWWLPWVSIRDLGKSNLVIETKETLSNLGVEKSNVKLIKEGALLFSFKLTVWTVAFAGVDLYTNEAIASFEPGNPRIDLRYLYYCLPIYAKKNVRTNNYGAPLLNKEIIKNMEIPLPSLEEQKCIVAKLDKLIELIDLKKEAIWKTEELTKSVFLDMFGDPILNNKNWELKKVKDFSEIRLGKMLDEKKQVHLKKYDYLGNSNVQWGYIEYKNISQMGFSEKDTETFELQYWDVLICEWWAIGRSAIWRENRKNIFFQKALHRLRPNKDIITSELVYFIMKSYVEGGYFDKHKNSATISHLTWIVLKEIEFPIPPLKLQLNFIKIYTKNSVINEEQNQSLQKIQELYNATTQEIFSF